jgi:antitoxin component YwqK of YwqJK toxin-antitoxin module
MKKVYSNGQVAYIIEGDILTYFYKSGKIKAQGVSINGIMQGEWRFYRETGQLMQIGNFRDNQKQGGWIRYDSDDRIEYHEHFDNGKIIKKK